MGEARTVSWGGTRSEQSARPRSARDTRTPESGSALKARPGASSAVAPAFSSHLRAAAAIHAGGSAAGPPLMSCRSVASIAVGFLSSDRMTTMLPDLFDRAGLTGRFAV